MSVHHLDCGTLRPVGGFNGRLAPPEMICHVLLVERAEGLLLVDTGFGTADLAQPERLGRPFVAMMRPAFDTAQCAVEQVTALGYSPSDVRDIALTHMDLDHAGGLGDFPQARVHVDVAELDAARNPRLSERSRYRKVQWSHRPDFVAHQSGGDDWFGFSGVKVLGDDVVLIPLRGHSRGHSGVAVRDGDRWLLHAGDSYFFNGEVETPPRTAPGLSAFQAMMATDNKARKANQERLRVLAAGHPEVTVFSAHDQVEFERLR
ncbi:MBL fold metallo-hydrolase [Nocardioides dubius]|uniref:MBL fold metallo-hydrolase n=1 Tax=Nocardioides dubius TaxID=317019 RepID=A0ABN1U4L5_9ACTN